MQDDDIEEIGAEEVKDEAEKEMQAKAEQILKKHFQNFAERQLTVNHDIDYEAMAEGIAYDLAKSVEMNKWAGAEKDIKEDLEDLSYQEGEERELDVGVFKRAIERILGLMGTKKSILKKIYSLF